VKLWELFFYWSGICGWSVVVAVAGVYVLVKLLHCVIPDEDLVDDINDRLKPMIKHPRYYEDQP
jgi:hypothetical protein